MAGRLHLAGGDQEFQPFGPVAARDTIEMLNQINGVRELLRYQRAAKQTTVDLAVPHTLESAVGRELRQGQLACADDTGKWEIEMEIRLYRERPSIARPGKEVVDRLGAFLARGDRT